MLRYLLRTRGIGKVLHSGFSSHTSKGFSTKPTVSKSAEQGKHKTQLQKHESNHHAQQHPASFVLIHHVFADPPSSTSEFLKAFGVLLEAPKKTGVVGR